MASKLTNCSVCGAEMAANAKMCPQCGAKNKKPIYKKWWFWVLIVIVVLGIIGATSDNKSEPSNHSSTSYSSNDPAVNNSKDDVNLSETSDNNVPFEYKNALKKAKSYSDTMYMSKQSIYDQLVSEYGEGFDADAAQYAIDNLDADYCANALKKAESYQKSMSMSRSAIYDQLISDYGEKFTEEEAQYAIDHLPE